MSDPPVVPGPWIGKGLLGDQWSADVDDVVRMLAIAYAAIGQGRDVNLAVWWKAREAVEVGISERLKRSGLEASPVFLDHLATRAIPDVVSPKPGEHVAFVRALFTDYGERFAEHCRYRLRTDGNLHFSFAGPTGSGKSSCALSVADWVRRIEPNDLKNHVNLDIAELPTKLMKCKAGETVVQDEFLAQTGEGANTLRAMWANLEDTLRASGVGLFVISPRRQEHATMQAELEAVFWNRDRRFTVFMAYYNGHPLGLVPVPWVRDELWKPYSEFKRANVERSVRAQFHDRLWMARTAMQLLDDANVIRYLIAGTAKPKKKQVEQAVRQFRSGSMTTSQTDAVSEWIIEVALRYDHFREDFEDVFGVPANEGFKKLAAALDRSS